MHHCREALASGDAVFDVGAWQSEVLWALHRVGFASLAGCDTDSRVARMPGARTIRYISADFFDLPLAPASLGALSCLSVLEHGVDVGAFLERSARLVRPGGRVLITTDYWPDPISTDGLEAFGRPWKIFSRADVESLIDAAARWGLRPDGPVALDAAEEAPISWNGRRYTFVWLAFVRER